MPGVTNSQRERGKDRYGLRIGEEVHSSGPLMRKHHLTQSEGLFPNIGGINSPISDDCFGRRMGSETSLLELPRGYFGNGGGESVVRVI